MVMGEMQGPDVVGQGGEDNFVQQSQPIGDGATLRGQQFLMARKSTPGGTCAPVHFDRRIVIE
eukprot:87292-Pyramimonas_sp.AAC.1